MRPMPRPTACLAEYLSCLFLIALKDWDRVEFVEVSRASHSGKFVRATNS